MTPLRVYIVASYMLICTLIATKPCKYFQLNKIFFNAKRGIFSKLEIDDLIPERWRLQQRVDDGSWQPSEFPVFAKPEWGQNASGVLRIADTEALTTFRHQSANEDIRYLLQAAAKGSREFEIFYIRHHLDPQQYAVLTITEAVNTSEEHPVNSINNSACEYVEITEQFSEAQLAQLWQLLGGIGPFQISRTSAKANSIDELLAGQFEIVEINLFVPMPLNMLDKRHTAGSLLRLVPKYMLALARATKYRDKKSKDKAVFCKIMLYHRRSRILRLINSFI